MNNRAKQLNKTQFEEHCKLLGITINIEQFNIEQLTIKTVNDKFKKLSLQFHPDRNSNPDTAETYKNIVNARDELIVHIQVYGTELVNKNSTDDDNIEASSS